MVTIAAVIYRVRSWPRHHKARVAYARMLQDACDYATHTERPAR